VLTLKIFAILCGFAFLAWRRGWNPIAPWYSWSESKQVRYASGMQRLREAKDTLEKDCRSGACVGSASLMRRRDRARGLVKEYKLEKDIDAQEVLRYIEQLCKRIALNEVANARERNLSTMVRTGKALTLGPPPNTPAMVTGNGGQRVQMELDTPFKSAARATRRAS